MSELVKKHKTSSKLFSRIDEEDNAVSELSCETPCQEYWMMAYNLICLMRWFLLYERIGNKLLYEREKLTPDERYLLSRVSGNERGLATAKSGFMKLIVDKERALNVKGAEMSVQPTNFAILMAQMLRTANFKDASTLLSLIKGLIAENYPAFSVHLLIDGAIKPRERVVKTNKLRGMSVRI